MKKVLKILGILVLALVLLLAAGLGVLTLREYRPAATEPVSVSAAPSAKPVPQGQTLRILSWNVGYGGLGAASDFFMDGGKNVKSADKATVEAYLTGIRETIGGADADLVLLQEVDLDSTRTYHIDETAFLGLSGSSAFAKNFSALVPYPLPPIGKVESGLYTVSRDYAIDSAQRESLPCPFSWPLRIANLKRCLLVSYLPVEGTDRQLVLINLHLEAYDSGEGKIAQTRQLAEFMKAEADKGNWVIAGGDFNQVFPGSLEQYPIFTPELWTPGVFDTDMLPAGFSAAADLRVPTCRLLNEPYNKETAQFYVIDDFVVSANVALESVETLDRDFRNSDHNPVLLQVTLRED